jgi:lambda repressor-like predicted transcriptional regulator
LSKGFDKSRVCTLLFNLDPADLKGPLTIFQSTRFVKDDFKRLVTSINAAAGEANLETSVLNDVFEMWWPRLEKQVSEILNSHKENPKEARRSDRDILEEIVNLTRINASRVSRPEISERAITDLMENLGELLFLVGIERSETAQSILRRIDGPLRHICMESGIPELYKRYRMRIRDRLLPESNIKEAKAEAGAAGNGQIAASERESSL